MLRLQVQSQEQMRLLHSAGVVQDAKTLESGVAGEGGYWGESVTYVQCSECFRILEIGPPYSSLNGMD